MWYIATMNVKRLINILEAYPDDYEVFISQSHTGFDKLETVNGSMWFKLRTDIEPDHKNGPYINEYHDSYNQSADKPIKGIVLSI